MALDMTFTRDEFNDDNFDQCFKGCGKGTGHHRANNQTQKGCWLNCRSEKGLADSQLEEQIIDSGGYNNNENIDVTNADWAQLEQQGKGRRRRTRRKRRRKTKRRRKRRRKTKRRRRTKRTRRGAGRWDRIKGFKNVFKQSSKSRVDNFLNSDAIRNAPMIQGAPMIEPPFRLGGHTPDDVFTTFGEIIEFITDKRMHTKAVAKGAGTSDGWPGSKYTHLLARMIEGFVNKYGGTANNLNRITNGALDKIDSYRDKLNFGGLLPPSDTLGEAAWDAEQQQRAEVFMVDIAPELDRQARAAAGAAAAEDAIAVTSMNARIKSAQQKAEVDNTLNAIAAAEQTKHIPTTEGLRPIGDIKRDADLQRRLDNLRKPNNPGGGSRRKRRRTRRRRKRRKSRRRRRRQR